MHRVDHLEVTRLDRERHKLVAPSAGDDSAVVAPHVGEAAHLTGATDGPALPAPKARSANAAPFVESGA